MGTTRRDDDADPAHLQLVPVALIAAVLVAVPLDLVLERARAAPSGWWAVAWTCSQTILLASRCWPMIPGCLRWRTARTGRALVVRVLYPIARETYTARSAWTRKRSRRASDGLRPRSRRRLFACGAHSRRADVIAGVSTAAVITVGAATLQHSSAREDSVSP
jgi:ABC-type proline/glycine betaine transport system permease subunit